MRGAVVNAEDYITNVPIRQLVLTASAPGEVATFNAIRGSGVRTLKISFSEKHNEIRILLPDACLNYGKKNKAEVE